MYYIELSTEDYDKYYLKGGTVEETEKHFETLMASLNDRRFISFREIKNNRLFAIPSKEVAYSVVIGEEDLPLTKTPAFIEIINPSKG